MNQPIYEQPQVMEPPAPAPAEPRYRLPSYGSVDVGGPALRIAEMDPELRLKKLKAEAQAKNAEKKRQTDRIVSPIIQEDLTQATAHERELQAELEKTRQALEMPYQRPGLDQYDAIAAGVATLFGGAQGFNQAVGGAYQRSDQQYDQNYQVQRQNAQVDFEMAQGELEQSRRRIDSLKSAYINAVAREDDFERDLVLQELKKESDREADLLNHAQAMEIEGQRNYRADLNDPRNRELAKRLASTPEGAQALGQIMGYDAQTIEALKAESARDTLLKAQAGLTGAKTKTEDEMRPLKLKKMDADIQRVLGGVALDSARKAQIEQKIAYYSDEFKLRAANIYSQIAKREADASGKSDKYFGQGSEETFRQMVNINTKEIEPLYKKILNGDKLTPEEQAKYTHHATELKRFQGLLEKTMQAKAGYHTGKQGGGTARKQIDTSGGFAPVNPMQVDTTLPKNPAGAKTPAKSAPKSGTVKAPDGTTYRVRNK